MTIQKQINREDLFERILPRVERPVRYTGGELNSVVKDWDRAGARFLFAFPDVYEVGMSHLGLQILYTAVNSQQDLLMERTFAPWRDMEQEMRREGIPLYSLESFHPASEFDMMGFTLQYEMRDSNILNMLELGGIPLWQKDRGEEDPLVIGGGPCAFNPEPLADFFDLFLVGDGEEVLPRLLELLASHKSGGSWNRKEYLLEAASLPGVYVPSFYDVEYDENGRIVRFDPVLAGVPETVGKALVKDLETAPFPEAPIVPFMDVVHDRIMLEVLRGCTHSCRFCQAGTVYRPVRERSGELLLKQAKALVASTGHEDISLTSLSTADHSQLESLVDSLMEEYRDRKISISLPSLRIDTYSVGLSEKISSVRKTGLTFAPEAGSQRMRDVINKGVTEEDLIRTVEDAFRAGWHRVKLYFMIGLPFEEYEDLDGIVRLANIVLKRGKEIARETGSRQTIQVTVSASSFVPKPFTPFQWGGQDPLEVLKEKQQYIRSRIRSGNLKFQYHNAETSHMEAVFARGDRRLGKVLHTAFSLGARFDGWDEFFDFGLWQRALETHGLTSVQYAQKEFDLEERLPWDHLDPGVRKSYLADELKAAKNTVLTPDCREAGCTVCGICMDMDAEMILAGERK